MTVAPSTASGPMAIRLLDGREATLRLGEESTVLAIEQEHVSAHDLCGRPFALVRDGWTWRRAFDGRWLRKGYGADAGPPRHVRISLAAEEGEQTAEAARLDALFALETVRRQANLDDELRSRALTRLERIVSMDAAAMAADAARFARVYRPLGILPPDQYLSCVVQVTEGCSWNGCTFCDSYRGTAFQVKSRAELERHVAEVKAFFGESLVLRRRVFLGSANALCVCHSRLLPLLETVARAFPVGAGGAEPPDEVAARRRHWTGLYSFVDVWTGSRKSAEELRAYRELGLRRVYLGLETGDPDLLSWLDKPGSPDDAVSLVTSLHEAGIGVAVIVLVGAGGEPFFDAHVARTASILDRMRLRGDDLVFFSDLVESPGSEYTRRAASDRIAPLDAGRRAQQRRAIAGGFRPADPEDGPRQASYDLREFVY